MNNIAVSLTIKNITAMACSKKSPTKKDKKASKPKMRQGGGIGGKIRKDKIKKVILIRGGKTPRIKLIQ